MSLAMLTSWIRQVYIHSKRPGVSPTLQALNSIPATEKLWTNCLNALQQICGDRAILPTAHVLSRGLVKRGKASITPHDTEGFWGAKYKRRVVCVRSLQMPPASEQAFMKVPFLLVCVIARHALIGCEEILPRGRTLEEAESPEHYLGTRRDDGAVPGCLRPSI